MRPSNSNLADKGCLPISSNCVIWQGPCLDCINLQTGDSVSDVVYKIATELCSITDGLELSSIDVSCLMESCEACPDPEGTLSGILTLLISRVCTLQELIGTPSEPVEPEEILVRVASCFEENDLNGDPVLDVELTDYVKMIANQVCSLKTTVAAHTSTLTSHNTRITALENQDTSGGDVTIPQVAPTCVFGGDTSAKDIDEVVEALESAFCVLKTATGTGAELLAATSKQCASLNSSAALSTSGNMSGIAGWKTTVSTVADSLNNMWITLCDMRAAVDAIKTCCAKTCDDVVINFLATVANNGATLKIYFSGYSILSGFEDCSGPGSQMTITDGVGGVHVQYINIVDATADPDAIEIDIASTPLTATGDFTFTLASCMTDGTLICNKTVVKTATGASGVCNPPTSVSAALS